MEGRDVMIQTPQSNPNSTLHLRKSGLGDLSVALSHFWPRLLLLLFCPETFLISDYSPLNTATASVLSVLCML